MNFTVPHCFHSLMGSANDTDRMAKVSKIVDNLQGLEKSHKIYQDQVDDLDDANFVLPDMLPKIQNFIRRGKEDLHNAGIDGIQQKKRLCSPNERDLRLAFLVILLVMMFFSMLATMSLDNIADHDKMFHLSAKLLWIIPTPGLRVIHRYFKNTQLR